ncbi:expressed unknown protein [Seminavis robusta]|uniref:Uncharacterized protein n=1 Tax=Seminavis robusta TaxID=568900 RepID=A0A9N8DTC7_9STRA|nr:expressed unknown protein [Seminavis robusta]|eukprot:Sro266_g103100.1 n/a (424) ;mRNA; r:28439-30366
MFASHEQKSHDGAHDSDKKNRCTSLVQGAPDVMEGLVLKHVLGYALNDSTTDFASFTAVNKEWNGTVKSLILPAMFQITKTFLKGGRAIVAKDLPLVTTVLRSLEDRNSPLYRLDSADGEEWPTLQPQFGVDLFLFVYKTCGSSDLKKQGSKAEQQNLSPEMYELLCNYLKTNAENRAQKIIQILSKAGGTSVVPVVDIFKELVGHLIAWIGIVHTVEIMSHYLGPKKVKKLTEHAQACFVTELLQAPGTCKMLGRLLKPAHLNIAMVPKKVLLQAYEVIKAIESFHPAVVRQWKEGVGDTLDEFLGSFRQQIKAEVEQSTMTDKAIEFYAINEQQPISSDNVCKLGLSLAPPQDLVRQEFPRHAQFVESMDPEELVALSFSSFLLGLGQFQLLVFAVSVNLRLMGPQADRIRAWLDDRANAN